MDTIENTANITEITPLELDEVRRRRVFAFVADYLLIALLSVFAGVIVFFFGLLTLGLGWALYGVIVPVITLAYFGLTLGGNSQASLGMNLFGLRIEFLDGRSLDFLAAVLHTILFWIGNMILPGIILLASLFSNRKRLLHDYLLGTVMLRSDE